MFVNSKLIFTFIMSKQIKNLEVMKKADQHQKAIEILDHINYYQKRIATHKKDLEYYQAMFINPAYVQSHLQLAERCLKFWIWKYNQIINQFETI